MQRFRRIVIASIMLAMISPALAAEKCFEKLPFGCFVRKTDVIAPGDQLDAIGKKLGTPLKGLSNTHMQVHGMPIQVNILEAGSDADAAALHKTILTMKNNPAYCLLRGRKVIEFVRADVTLAIKTAYELGLVKKPTRIQYQVTAYISPIEKADYMAANKLFNLFLTTNTRRPTKEVVASVEKLSKGFTFGKSVSMRSPQKGDSYTFAPKPSGTQEQGRDGVVYTFEKPPAVLGVPYVKVQATLSCNNTGVTPTRRVADKSLLGATPFWPVDDPQVVALAQKIIAGKKTEDAKVMAILEWLTPGRNIKYSGAMGSRWGVKKVLEQKFGRCWDSSDCFVTLARAAGIPARQVAGWLYGTSGHVWAEVLVSGKGWRQVDATGGGKLPCEIYHIPYFTTETGEMPILYLSMPQIKIVGVK